jgi:hypothetical protein
LEALRCFGTGSATWDAKTLVGKGFWDLGAIEFYDRFNERIRLLTVLVEILWHLDGSLNSRIPLSASFYHSRATKPVPHTVHHTDLLD